MITKLHWRKWTAFFKQHPTLRKGDLLEVLTTLIEAYEEKYYSIPLPDPVEAIL